jgi:thiol-disulfide isomerase/thioredoxin
MKNSFLSLLFVCLLISFKPMMSQDKLDFDAKLLSGEEIQFSNLYKDGVTLVNFWALWCKPCRVEMKALKKIYDKYSNQGLNIVGINQDTPRSVNKVESFVKSQRVEYDIILDPNKELFEMFNGQAVPYTLIYDKSGTVVYKATGYLPGDEIKLEEKIKETLEAAE